MLVAASIVTSSRCLFSLPLPLHARAGSRGNDAFRRLDRAGTDTARDCVRPGQESGMEIAYSLASEELHPTDMVQAARRAEELGFQNVFFGEEVLPKV